MDEKKGDLAFNALFVNGHPKGSLMTRIAAVELKADTNELDIKSVLAKLDELPTKILKLVLTWLLVMGALIALIEFLGPSLKKTMGLNATIHQTVLADRNQPENAQE